MKNVFFFSFSSLNKDKDYLAEQQQQQQQQQRAAADQAVADTAIFEPFPTDAAKIPAQSLELGKWFRKMAGTEEPMLILDKAELAPDAKEYLFPCAQDEYTLSDSLKPEDSNDFLEGETC